MRFSRQQQRLLGIFLVAVAVAVVRYYEPDIGTGSDDAEAPDEVIGRARVIDGDSLRIDGHEIRMVGIDAPEGRQTCDRDGRSWRCGEASAERLRALVAGTKVRCDVEDIDQYDRLLATCHGRGRNLNQQMVRQGWAVSYGRRYNSEERAAERQSSGIWASQFERPRTWRDRNMR